jgi:hypothetical protein
MEDKDDLEDEGDMEDSPQVVPKASTTLAKSSLGSITGEVPKVATRSILDKSPSELVFSIFGLMMFSPTPVRLFIL